MLMVAALNMMNTWLNAEVLGRVLVQHHCEQKDLLSEIWGQAVSKSAFIAWSHVDFGDMVGLAYMLVFLQPVVAIVFALPLDPERVDYQVSTHEGGCHKYKTMWHSQIGTDHKAAVQVLSTLSSCEAVTFQDAHFGAVEMDTHVATTDGELRNIRDQDPPTVSHREYLEAWDRVGAGFRSYLAEVTGQLSRSAINFIYVGVLQNAVMCKIQISFLSLDMFLENGRVQPLLLIGVIGNLLVLLIVLFDFFEIFELYNKFHMQTARLWQAIEELDCRFRKEDDRKLLLQYNRICFGFKVSLIAGVPFLFLVLYEWLNFVMVFRCEDHVWNFAFPPQSGCVDGLTMPTWPHSTGTLV